MVGFIGQPALHRVLVDVVLLLTHPIRRFQVDGVVAFRPELEYLAVGTAIELQQARQPVAAAFLRVGFR